MCWQHPISDLVSNYFLSTSHFTLYFLSVLCFLYTCHLTAATDNIRLFISDCPNAISVTIPLGSTGVAITWTEPTATDSYGSVATKYASSPGDIFNVGTTLVIAILSLMLQGALKCAYSLSLWTVCI